MMVTSVPRIVVVGGGLHGCCAALHLARGGAKVTVIEKSYPGRHASGVNAGGVRTLNRHFAEVPLSLAALDIWYQLTKEVGDNGGFVNSKQVRVAENVADLEQFHSRVARLREMGFIHERVIGAKELRSIVPAISRHCPGALVADGDGYADPFRTTNAYHEAARREGVRFVLGAKVTAIEFRKSQWRVSIGNETFEGDMIVNSSGAWGAETCTMIGDRVELVQDALIMTVTQRLAPFVVPVVGSQSRKLSLKQAKNGTVVIGGGYKGEIDPVRGALVDFDVLPDNLRAAVELFPNLRDAIVLRCWAGVEGRTVDQIPAIGWSPNAEGVFHAFGFSAHGFELGPIVGKLASKILLTGCEEPLFLPFRLERFERAVAVDAALNEE